MAATAEAKRVVKENVVGLEFTLTVKPVSMTAVGVDVQVSAARRSSDSHS